ncbi:hypothetical protein [Stutzerimonas azotifigens]|uniref:hypothetical protein n=1 Tax=Stutzerimonas azotifigens TaxID=291995 RepID=UPI0004215839|nr:hypothetical protein [Stutzerimonas azotifigens]
MPQLVMTSGLRHALLALLAIAAAVLGSARPPETPLARLRSPEVPALLLSGEPWRRPLSLVTFEHR